MLLFGRGEEFSFCIGFIKKDPSTLEWLIHCLFLLRIHRAYTLCCVLIHGDTERFQPSVDHSDLGRWYQDRYGTHKLWGIIFYSQSSLWSRSVVCLLEIHLKLMLVLLCHEKALKALNQNQNYVTNRKYRVWGTKVVEDLWAGLYKITLVI